MTRIELTHFIGNVYERFSLTRENGIVEGIWGSARTSVRIPVYEGEKHIDDMPLTAYMILAELNYLGGTVKVPDMFRNFDLSGFSDGYISGLLSCLAKRGFVETNAQTSPRVISEMRNGIRHIQNPDGSTHLIEANGRSHPISVGLPPQGLSTNEYRLKDLEPYHVQFD